MNKNRLILSNTNVVDNTVEYIYEVTGEWSRFFIDGETFFIEYDFPLDGIPSGILVIPFLSNVLPISWVSDAEIIVPEIDRDFYESIPEFKQGYINMYPMINFKGNLCAEQIVKYEGPRSDCAMLFSGGVDSKHTMISHLNEKPALICIWGADVYLDDEKGWSRVNTHLTETADNYGFNHATIKSSFRKIINQGELDLCVSASGNGWWYGFQHGIALICHTAPYMYVNKLKTLYIASSIKATEDSPIASYYTIDPFVRFSGSNVVHDGANHNRQEKICEICTYANKMNKEIHMRVCWQSLGGGNCNNCEKCFRTMLAIVAEGHNPVDYGFVWNKQVKRRLKCNFLLRYPISIRDGLRYGPTIERIRETAVTKEQKKQWRWLITKTPEQLDNTFGKKLFNFIKKTRIWRFIRQRIRK